MTRSYLSARFMMAGLVALGIGLFSGCKAISFVKLKYMGTKVSADFQGYRKYMMGKRQNIESTTQKYALYAWNGPDEEGKDKRHEGYDLVPINWTPPANNQVEIFYRVDPHSMRKSVTPSRLVANSQNGLAYTMIGSLVLGVIFFIAGAALGKDGS